MVTADFLKDSLLKKAIFFTGKGGVGKSTLTFATALMLRRAGKKPIVASWEPDTLDADTPAHPLDGLKVDRLRLDALTCFREYALQTLRFERVYDAVFDNHVLRTFIKTTPGVADGVIARKIVEVAASGVYDTVLVDLPSTGHTISFFKSPMGIRNVFSLGAIHRQATEICEFFESDKTRVDFVSLPEELPLTEARLLTQELKRSLNLRYGFFHLNQLTPAFALPDTAKLPVGLRPLRELYEARYRNEAEAMCVATELGLPRIAIPLEPQRLTTDVIERVADVLERA